MRQGVEWPILWDCEFSNEEGLRLSGGSWAGGSGIDDGARDSASGEGRCCGV